MELRQCSLALDKWEGMFVAYEAIFLGLLYDARKLTVKMTEAYMEEL
jgi:hypothetical protein